MTMGKGLTDLYTTIRGASAWGCGRAVSDGPWPPRFDLGHSLFEIVNINCCNTALNMNMTSI